MPPRRGEVRPARAAASRQASRLAGSSGGRQYALFQQETARPPSPGMVVGCDAPVAGAVLRIRACLLNAPYILAGAAVFSLLYYLVAPEDVFSRRALPVHLAAVAAISLFYAVLCAVAGTDSIGMRWAGLRLVDFNGSLPGPGQRLSRLAATLLSLAAVGAGLLWALLDPERLGWHDHISKTFPSPRVRQ